MGRARLAVLAIATGVLAGALYPTASPAASIAQNHGTALASGDSAVAVLITGIGALLAVALLAALLARQLLATR
jgi:predicted Na+-dependent transporter